MSSTSVTQRSSGITARAWTMRDPCRIAIRDAGAPSVPATSSAPPTSSTASDAATPSHPSVRAWSTVRERDPTPRAAGTISVPGSTRRAANGGAAPGRAPTAGSGRSVVPSYESTRFGANDSSTRVAPAVPDTSTCGRSSTVIPASGAAVSSRAWRTSSSNAETSNSPSALATVPSKEWVGAIGRIRCQPVVSRTTASRRVEPCTFAGCRVSNRYANATESVSTSRVKTGIPVSTAPEGYTGSGSVVAEYENRPSWA